METLSREEVGKIAGDYQLIFDTESHHDHEVIRDKHGTIRWKQNPVVRLLTDITSLNDILPEMHEQGYYKNGELYRQMYRDMGYSLSGYWEIFYWDMNNEEWQEYEPNTAI